MNDYQTDSIKKENFEEAVLRLESVINTAIDGIISIDTKGIIETVNPAAAKMFGYAQEEIIGKNVNILMPSPHHENHDGYINRYLKTKEARIIGIGREVQGKKKDGTLFPLRLAISKVELNGKALFTGILHDLTEVKEAESKILSLNKALEEKVKERTEKLANVVDRLLETNQKLQEEIRERESVETALRKSEKELHGALGKEKELNALKSRFVSMASHEFRTPLSTILSSVELIEAYRREQQQPKREKHVNRIKTSVHNLSGVLNDFLSLSRLEEGKIEARPESFFLGDFCKEVLEEVKSLARRGQTIYHEEGNDGEVVFLDKQFLKNIMLNLISNAIKYSREEQPIYCSAKVKRKELWVRIRDEGIGIPEEDQRHLFTRFFRAHNVENIKGTGLGLNIVRRYVDLLGGKINFESKLGKGTTFIVRIPLMENA